MEPTRESGLKHIGILRRSGRYPWGSGENPYQRSAMFKGFVNDMREKGLSDTQIAQAIALKDPEKGTFSTTELRDTISLSDELIKAENKAVARHLVNEKQMSVRAVAERMLGSTSKESTVRGWLRETDELKDKALTTIAGILRGHLGTKKWLDVGKGTELHMGVSDVRLRAAVSALRDEGYELHDLRGLQLGTNNITRYKVLGPPGSTKSEARQALNQGLVYNVIDKSADGGLTFTKPAPEPVSINSNRLQVRYLEDGGGTMDGVIELRRGVPELDLGANNYAQVRVAVDGTHYLKGMAMYANDLPAGTDIRFNSNKPRGTPLTGEGGVLKPLKEGIENSGNRFGATTRPVTYTDSNGETRTSALNMVNEEGAWDKWSRSLSSQMLSKQPVTLAATQLTTTRKDMQDELNKLNALTNPLVKKQLLYDFAESADASAVNLKARALPDQSSHVILPMNSMRPNEVYAPNFDNGTRVALVRYPHGGPFEIPQLTVNNNNATAKQVLGGVKDAIGIHHSVAQQLSGADFDGDAVLVIPNNSNRVKSKPPLQELEDFHPNEAYPESPGMKYMTPNNTQREMGKISNLITDMTIKGAPDSEIARAVKHSMVVIDAEKKKLDYKLSEKVNGITQLKARYQSDPANPRSRGASTIISRSSAKEFIPHVRPRRESEGGFIDPATGELKFVPTGRTRLKTTTNPSTGEKTTEVVPLQTKTTRMAVTKDAFALSSGEPMESVYAQHANEMKDLANEARRTAYAIKDPPQSPAAKAIYAKEVESLKVKLRNAQMNAPIERRAQTIARATAKARIAATPEVDSDQAKKITYQALRDARLQTGAYKNRIGSVDKEGREGTPLTTREWEAIQSGAVASTTVKEILQNSDMDTIRELATPRRTSSLSPGQIALAKSMKASGRNISEIAAALGIPRTTLSDNLAKS